MDNKIKIIATIIVALFIVGFLTGIIHYFTNTRKHRNEEDEQDLSDLTPIDRDQGHHDNTLNLDQLAEIDRLLDSWDIGLILDAQRKLETLSAENPNESQFLYRLGKCCHHLVQIEESQDRSKLIQKGIGFCRRALKLENHDAEIQKWFAILVGLRAESSDQPMKDRFTDSSTFKRHIEIALELDPNDDCLHFVMGRYMYEVASLSWAQRGLANWLFDAQFNSTYEDALKYFLKTADLNINWKENMLYVGKCYNMMGNYAEGTRQLKIARNLNGSNKDLPTRDINDEINDELLQYSL